MKRKVGTYRVGYNHQGWGIWKVVSASENGTSPSSDKVESCETGEQAFRRMYELNGWGEPKRYPEWTKKNGIKNFTIIDKKDTNKKLENIKKEFNETIDHANDVLEEYANTLTEKILVDAFKELSVEDQMLVLSEVDENKPMFDFDFAIEHDLDYETLEALQRLEKKLLDIKKMAEH